MVDEGGRGRGVFGEPFDMSCMLFGFDGRTEGGVRGQESVISRHEGL